MKAGLFIIISIAMLALGSCSKGSDRPVPRREGFPRIEVVAAEYATVPSLPVHFEVNAAADVEMKSTDGGAWLDISYPQYGATAYCTLTRVDDDKREEVMANRMERIQLNLGGAHAQAEEWEPRPGAYALTARASAGTATPLQFICAQGDWVMSGAVMMPGAAHAPADSIAPILDVLMRDIRHSINTMACE